MRRIAILALLAGCGQDDPTQVMVQIHADSSLQSANGTLTVSVEGRAAGETFGPAGPPLDIGTTNAADFPYVVALAPENDDATREWRLGATLQVPGGTVEASAQGRYEKGRVVQVDIFLTRACVGMPCGDRDQTCVAGECADNRVDVGSLPDYTGPMSRDAGSFDAGDGGTVDAGDAGADAGADAGSDTGPDDAGPDAADGGADTGVDAPDAGPCGMPCTPEPCFAGIVDCTGEPVCMRMDMRPPGTDCGVGSCDSAGVCRVVLDAIPRPVGLGAGAFGPAIAVSAPRVIVGSPTGNRLGEPAGRVDEYLVGAVITHAGRLLPIDGAMASDAFGDSVAISGARIAASFRRNQVLVFDFMAPDWVQAPALTEVDHEMDDEIWLQGNRLMASGRNRSGDTTLGRIASYEFGASWLRTDQIDGESTTGFAARFDTDAATTVIGGSGDVQVYTQLGSDWSLDGSLADPFGSGNEFGRDVAVDGDTIFVGTPRALQPDGGAFTVDGTVWLFTRLGAGLYSAGEELVLRDFDAEYSDRYGQSVEIATSDRLVVGAPNGNYVVVWERDAFGSWWEVLRLEPRDGDVAGFGERVAADGNLIVIYADEGEAPADVGEVFVVDLTP